MGNCCVSSQSSFYDGEEDGRGNKNGRTLSSSIIQMTDLSHSNSNGIHHNSSMSTVASDSRNHRSRNVSIDQSSNIIRLFLIGTGEVGKSTIIRIVQKLCLKRNSNYQYFDDQWQYQTPFTDELKASKKHTIFQNVYTIIGTLITKALEFELHFDSEEHERFARDIMDEIGVELEFLPLHSTSLRLSSEMADKIAALWRDDVGAIRGAWNRRREFILSANADYFLNAQKLQEIAHPGYIPSVDDLLNARDPTTGVRDYNFRMHKVRLCIRDVGGQASERMRLLRYLETWLSEERPQDRSFILYVASLADYNQQNREHPSSTNLDESIFLLRVLMNLRELSNVGFILFLNKKDVFEQKLHEYDDFHQYFHQYLDRHNLADRRITAHQAARLITEKFGEAMADTIRRDESLYCQITRAVDWEMMEGIFHAVKHDILNNIVARGSFIPFP